jgi:hypothetical protein
MRSGYPQAQNFKSSCMVTSYLRSLNYSPSSFDSFYVVTSGRDSYYVCAYKDRNNAKKDVMELLTMLPAYQKLTIKDFDFHHIVEEQHLADITFSNELYFNYGNMPTVLVHKGEHQRYNAILHVKESRSLYLRDQEKFTGQKLRDSHARKQATITLLNNGTKGEGIEEISNRISILKEMYSSVYEGNRILKTISNNIFDAFKHELKISFQQLA